MASAPDLGAWRHDRRGVTVLRWAAVLYGAAWLIHTGDHLRRGTDVVTSQVHALGTAAALLQLVAIGLVLARHRIAPVLAVAVGIPDAFGIAAVHLLPRWSVFSDAFPGAHGTGVTAFSWVAAIVEVLTALAFGLVGAWVLGRLRSHHLQPVTGSLG